MANRDDKVLLVEDSKPMQLMVQSALKGVCELVCVSSLAEARAEIAKNFSLVLLDVSLPDGSGFELCKEIRGDGAIREVPIIFLTGEAEVSQRVLGFDLGADDYIVKPFEPQEFVARVSSRLRKASAQPKLTLQKSIFRVDLKGQRVYVKTGEDEAELILTPIEFKLFLLLMERDGRTVSREELITSVWGKPVQMSANTLDTHISSLRKKIAKHGACLKTVARQGYCFELST